MTLNPLVQLGALGQSPWYDFITRDLVTSGELHRLIAEDGLMGMTSNPTIFEKAIAGSHLYDDAIRQLTDEGKTPAEIFERIAVADVRAACEAFLPVHARTDGAHGFVSLEVAPILAHDTASTVAEARRLWHAIGQPNAMIKIPGTSAGLPAITQCIAEGINVNVTLLFAVRRYQEVIDAYQAGLQRRIDQGLRVDGIASVASFFVSRIDTKIDPLLEERPDVRSRVAIANACCAYDLFQRSLVTPHWRRLSAEGAQPQRPLWASTSTKDPCLPDTYYIEALIAPHTVNTLPPETFAAYRHHGNPKVRIFEGISAAPRVLQAAAEAGISLDQVTRELEDEGVAKFAASHRSVLSGIESKVGELAASR